MYKEASLLFFCSVSQLVPTCRVTRYSVDLWSQRASMYRNGVSQAGTRWGWDWWSRIVTGGGAETRHGTTYFPHSLERTEELCSIGGTRRDHHWQDHGRVRACVHARASVTIASGEESWVGERSWDFKESEGFKVYIIKKDLKSLRYNPTSEEGMWIQITYVN